MFVTKWYINLKCRAGRMAQALEHLPSKHKALSSTPQHKEREGGRKEGKEKGREEEKEGSF
jgi:hypothetical protein